MDYVEKLLANNEQIAFMTRKHLVVFASALLADFIISAIIVMVALLGAALTAPIGGIGIFLAAFVVFPTGHLIVTLVKWSSEQYIITNRRVIKVEGFINKHVFDSSLEKVNDVVLNQDLLGRMLNYGNIEILTGSDIGANKFTRIANPVEFKREMLNQKEAMGVLNDVNAKEQRILESPPPSQGDIPELIAELDELRKKGIISQQEFETKKAELLKRL
jgi:uncharacterized membrane protein YdbT with pleckstrin-like domain